MKKSISARGILVPLILLIAAVVFGQEALPRASLAMLDPIFPPENPGLIQIEAESAVSTNFAAEATLNYAASGYRALQLNRYTGLYGDAAFYTEFVFYVGPQGTYEFWYGGTPPGPDEDVFPSYSSPFTYSIDDGPAQKISREQVVVASGYTPGFYWVFVDTLELSSGVHKLRIEVSEKRRHDGKYLFYLDSIFFIDRGRADLSGAAPIPAVFPEDLDDRSVDSPFKSVNDFRYLITLEPNNPLVYVEFSLIYSLIGDYLNALRNINKALLLDPENADVALLAAKYRLWKGEADEALKAYRRVLDMDSEMKEGWTEAGKVAAWIGKYDESISFYRDALQAFPDDLNLKVNMALTYLWASRVTEAERTFSQAESSALKSGVAVLELGEIYIANGYADRAIDVYAQGIREFPEHIELYLELERAYLEAGRAELSVDVHNQLRERFVESERLDVLLDTFELEQGPKLSDSCPLGGAEC